MADRRDHPAHNVEAEPVMVETTPRSVELILDDGLSLTFTRQSLEDCLNPTSAQFGGTDA